jgi:hypothetical protein
MSYTGAFLAGIQEVLLDSGQEHAGMTVCQDGHSILVSCTWKPVREEGEINV